MSIASSPRPATRTLLHSGARVPLDSVLRTVTWEGALANVFVVLTGGAFLTGLALMFGANAFAIGLLGAIPFLAQLTQLLAPLLMDRLGGRKTLVVRAVAVGRQLWWLAIPLLFLDVPRKLEVLLTLVVVSSVATMLATPAFMAWIADLVPTRVRGRYFGTRSASIAATTVVATLAGGASLDFFRIRGQEPMGYAVILILACITAALSLRCLRLLPDRNPNPVPARFDFDSLLAPLRDTSFKRLLRVFFVWNVAIGLAAVFFAAHMLTNLKMSFTEIAFYSSGVALVSVVTTRLWGQMIDRFGSKPVAAVCAFGIALIPMIWWLPRAGHLEILIFEGLFSGIVWAGFNLAAFNIPIANSPRDNRTAYLAIFSVVTGIGFFVASMIGGGLAQSLAQMSWHWNETPITNYHVLFAVSSALRLLAAIAFLGFHEPGEKSFPVMMQFMGYAVLKRVSLGRQLFPFGPEKDTIDR